MKKAKGTNKKGDLQKALDNAIAQAKHDGQTLLIDWKLLHVSGTNGGFVNQKDITVEIEYK